MVPPLNDQQLERYSRQIILDEIGEEGQQRLLGAKVLVIGAGGLGSPVLLYLAAAGIGQLGVVDDDVVDRSNLQRQIIHTTARIGQNKAYSAAQTLGSLNPDIQLHIHPERITAANIRPIFSPYDLIIDGSDNFPTRYLVHDVCFFLKKPLLSAALLRFEGQITTWKGYLGHPHPCYRCLFPEAPATGTVPRCQTAGILGSVAATLGSMLATETVKEILGLGTNLSGLMLLYNALEPSFQQIRLEKQSSCRFCNHPQSWENILKEEKQRIDGCQIP